MASWFRIGLVLVDAGVLVACLYVLTRALVLLGELRDTRAALERQRADLDRMLKVYRAYSGADLG